MTIRDEPGPRSGTGVEKVLPDTTTCVSVSELLFVTVHRVGARHDAQLATMTAMKAMRKCADI